MRVAGLGWGVCGKMGLGAVCGRVVRLLVVCGVLVVGVGVACPGSALALAALEAPEVSVEAPVHASEATFLGVLNPKASEQSEEGSYSFLYNKGAKCEGGAVTASHAAQGFPDEVLAGEVVKGLTAGSEYSVCLVETNVAKSSTVSSGQVHFKTALPPEKPETASPAKAVTATSATLEGTLNPAAEAETGYYFLYSLEPTCANGSASTVEAVAKVKAKTKVHAEVTGLQPHKKYVFCLVATNSAGETVDGNEVAFETLASRPSVISESVGLKPGGGRLEAVVDPNNEATECHFEYGETLVSEHRVACEPPVLEGYGEDGVGANVTGLTQDTTYHYRVLVKNGTGSTSEESEFTTGTPEPPETTAASDVTSSSAKLNGVLNPNHAGEAGAYDFFYKQSGSECELDEAERNKGLAQSTTSTAAAGAGREAGEAVISGLLPGTTYTFCLRAINGSGEPAVGNAVSFTTLPVAPSIPEGEVVSGDETASSVQLSGRIDPGGAETKYSFQYGTTSGYGDSVPVGGGSVPAGVFAVPVAVTVQGLSANTTYHWRLVAENTAGKATTADHTFIYDTSGGKTGSCPDEQARVERNSTRLPDCRAYELVTPADKNGALVGNSFRGAGFPQVAENGRRVIVKSIQCFEHATSCVPNRKEEGSPFEFQRTAAGWVTHPLTPPAGELETYSAWSINANEGTMLFSAPVPTAAPTGEFGSQEEWFAREPDGELAKIGPLEEEGLRAGEGRERNELGYLGLATGEEEVVATANLSHVVYYTKESYWRFDHTELTGGVGLGALYEYVGRDNAAPLMVGVKGGYDSHELVSPCATAVSAIHEGKGLARYVSESGRTVYFTPVGRDRGACAGSAGAPAADELWARVDGEIPGGAHSVLISAPTAGVCETAECREDTSTEPAKEAEHARDANFEGASADGSVVVFSSEQQLTDNATQNPTNETVLGGQDNLYESVCAEPCGTAGEEPGAKERRLIDVSDPSGDVKVAGGPRVLGVVALSEDGSHVYFVAQGKLAGNRGALGEEAVDGEDNLYVYERDEAHPGGRLAFIATLAPGDEVLNWNRDFPAVANVTPDGGFLVFTSSRALTSDVTRPEGPEQVYEYDAQSGVLTRISVGEDGFNDDGNEGTGSASIVAAFIQAAVGKSVPARTDPTMSHDGSYVFFRSPVALTAGALNDVPIEGEFFGPHPLAQNFYEYHEGQVYLISDGKDTSGHGQDSETGGQRVHSTPNLLGSDASGASVFFSTFDPLVPEDTDTQLDYYDARICSEGEPCVAPVLEPSLCGEGSCQRASGSSPGYGVPASETFSGDGNLTPTAVPVVRVPSRTEKLAAALKACRRKRDKRKRVACEKRARKAYGAKKASAGKKSGKKKGGKKASRSGGRVGGERGVGR